MEKNVLEDHSAYNRFMIGCGLNQTEMTNEPSEYITHLKVRRMFRAMSNEEIENLFDKEMNLVAVKRHREILEKKLSDLHKWQLFKAFRMCDEFIYIAATYVMSCKKSDNKEEVNNEPNL